MESKCWKKNPELIPNKVEAARKKQAEKKAEKTSTAATAVEDEMILTVLDMQKEDNKCSCFDMNDAFNVVPINKDIVNLENIFNISDKKSDDEKGCHEESDDKDRGSGDDEPLVTVSESNEDACNLDLSLSAVANAIADANFMTGAHILESQDIWIVDTGATSHVLTKHTEGGMKHCQTSVQTSGFAGQIPDNEHIKLWPEAVKTATHLNNLMPVTIRGVTQTCWEHAGYKVPKWTKTLQTFGEAGIVKEGKKGKVLNRGLTMMFVGYSEDHAKNVFQMYNPVAIRIVQTRDVIWMGRIFHTQAGCRSYTATTNCDSTHQLS